MLASQSSMVRDYRELSYFFEMIDLKVTNTANLMITPKPCLEAC